MSDKKEFCYKTTLKTDYGLTQSWIDRLGEPDKFVVNPHYRSGPPASLYRRERVELFIDENKEAWEALQIRRAKRSQVATRVNDEKRGELMAWANKTTIKLKNNLPKNFKKLTETVLLHGFDFYDSGDFFVSPNAVIAYIRHNRTNYEDLLDQASGNVGVFDAYVIIKQRVNEFVESTLVELYGDNWQGLI